MQQFPIGLDVVWQSASDVSLPDKHHQDWLVDTGSLTERITSQCSVFEVQVLGQGKVPLHLSEMTCLTRESNQYHVREVILKADNYPWVFARSVIPESLAKGEWAALGSSPLGKVLFNDNRFVRGGFDIATIRSSHFTPCCKNINPNINLFGRRSVFHYASTAILVAEVFLPESPIYRRKESD